MIHTLEESWVTLHTLATFAMFPVLSVSQLYTQWDNCCVSCDACVTTLHTMRHILCVLCCVCHNFTHLRHLLLYVLCCLCHNFTHTCDTCYVSCVACVTTLHTHSACMCVPVCSCVSDCRNNLITAGWCFAESDTDTAWIQPPNIGTVTANCTHIGNNMCPPGKWRPVRRNIPHPT